jgi:hypothetical protein
MQTAPSCARKWRLGLVVDGRTWQGASRNLQCSLSSWLWLWGASSATHFGQLYVWCSCKSKHNGQASRGAVNRPPQQRPPQLKPAQQIASTAAVDWISAGAEDEVPDAAHEGSCRGLVYRVSDVSSCHRHCVVDVVQVSWMAVQWRGCLYSHPSSEQLLSW